MMLIQGVSAHSLDPRVFSVLEFAQKVRLVCDWCGTCLEQEWVEPVVFPMPWIRIPMQEGWIGFYDACSPECERALNELITHKVVVSEDWEDEATVRFRRPATFERWMEAWETRWKKKRKN